MSADLDGPKNFRAGPDVDVATDLRCAPFTSCNCDLLEYQTIDADLSFRMDDDPIGVGNEEAAAYVAVKGDVRAGNDAPKSMPKGVCFARKGRE